MLLVYLFILSSIFFLSSIYHPFLTPHFFLFIHFYVKTNKFHTIYVILCEQIIFTCITDSELFTELEKIKEIFLIPAR